MLATSATPARVPLLSPLGAALVFSSVLSLVHVSVSPRPRPALSSWGALDTDSHPSAAEEHKATFSGRTLWTSLSTRSPCACQTDRQTDDESSVVSMIFFSMILQRDQAPFPPPPLRLIHLWTVSIKLTCLLFLQKQSEPTQYTLCRHGKIISIIISTKY